MKSSIFKPGLWLVSVFITFMPNLQLSNWGDPLDFSEAGSPKLSFLSQLAVAQEKQ